MTGTTFVQSQHLESDYMCLKGCSQNVVIKFLNESDTVLVEERQSVCDYI